MKINVTNITNMAIDVTAEMDVDVYDYVAIMTHLFMGQY
jgi:hypothetical protein